jgi:hypothetical protein
VFLINVGSTCENTRHFTPHNCNSKLSVNGSREVRMSLFTAVFLYQRLVILE